MRKITFLASALLVAMLAMSGCKADSKTSTKDQEKEMAMTQNVTELIKKDTVVGEGREAEAGINVTVHYTGWLYDTSKADGKGTKFDSSGAS